MTSLPRWVSHQSGCHVSDTPCLDALPDATPQRAQRTLRRAPSPLSLEARDGGENAAPSPKSPSSPTRAKAAALTPEGLAVNSAADMGGFAELTASSMLKYEALHLRRHALRNSKSFGSQRSGAGEHSPQPGSAGVGFSFWTEKQRLDLEEQYLRHNSRIPWYDWALSFEKSDRGRRATPCCWALDKSNRSAPEQWLHNQAQEKGVYLEGMTLEKRLSNHFFEY
ncbi:unnamed protein product [Effrenium voratum]|nr:unnamed protein product [Effrenium voratum]